MNRNTVVALLLVVACIAGFLIWRLGEPAPAQPIGVQSKVESPAPHAKPEWFQAKAQQPEARIEAPAPAAPPAAPPEAKPAEPAAVAPMLTAETLAGTKWQDNKIEVAFLPDGRWQLNGRICAKWEVNGDKVRIFDDKGEEHFVDIVGDSLAFNGQKIGRAPTAP